MTHLPVITLRAVLILIREKPINQGMRLSLWNCNTGEAGKGIFVYSVYLPEGQLSVFLREWYKSRLGAED